MKNIPPLTGRIYIIFQSILVTFCTIILIFSLIVTLEIVFNPFTDVNLGNGREYLDAISEQTTIIENKFFILVLTSVISISTQMVSFIWERKKNRKFIWKKCKKDIFLIVYNILMGSLFNLLIIDFSPYIILLLFCLSFIIKILIYKNGSISLANPLLEVTQVFLIVFFLHLFQNNYYKVLFEADSTQAIWSILVGSFFIDIPILFYQYLHLEKPECSFLSLLQEYLSFHKVKDKTSNVVAIIIDVLSAIIIAVSLNNSWIFLIPLFSFLYYIVEKNFNNLELRHKLVSKLTSNILVLVFLFVTLDYFLNGQSAVATMQKEIYLITFYFFLQVFIFDYVGFFKIVLKFLNSL
ncbi:hypothetical protein ACVR1G_03815 [Streptococcus dentasini]